MRLIERAQTKMFYKLFIDIIIIIEMMTLKMTMTKKMRCTELSRSPWPEAARANLLFAETIMIVMTIIMIIMTIIMATIMITIMVVITNFAELILLIGIISMINDMRTILAVLANDSKGLKLLKVSIKAQVKILRAFSDLFPVSSHLTKPSTPLVEARSPLGDRRERPFIRPRPPA